MDVCMEIYIDGCKFMWMDRGMRGGGGGLLWNASRITWKTDEDRRRLENLYGWMQNYLDG
jgi:hypothetical protein